MIGLLVCKVIGANEGDLILNSKEVKTLIVYQICQSKIVCKRSPLLDAVTVLMLASMMRCHLLYLALAVFKEQTVSDRYYHGKEKAISSLGSHLWGLLIAEICHYMTVLMSRKLKATNLNGRGLLSEHFNLF